MALNPKFMIAPSLQEYFVDKTTGLPLSGGKVYFWSDVNRSTPKAIYSLSGTPPNYTYTQLPNPSILSGVGTFQDAGNNDILPYYYPYDADGNTELYFIEVYDENDTFQFDREAWPNITADSTGSNLENVTNFIPNGQFLTHNNIPANILIPTVPGQVVQDVTSIAAGGWTFERSSGSTAVDNVSFFKYGGFVDPPSASPKYSLQVKCITPDPSDAFKTVRLKFTDVNKFSSDSQGYTFAFSASTVSSGNFQVGFNLIKFFGTGGSPSPTESILLEQFTISSSETIFQSFFLFGSNEGKQIGTNNDDYLQLEISFPTDVSFNGRFTDFLLLSGDVLVSSFPQTTDRDFLVRSISPTTSDPDGYDLFLLPIRTLDGMAYDYSPIGKVYPSSVPFTGSLSTTTNEMLADGSQYLTAGYSSLGIPFKRLQSFYYIDSINQPMYGTGANFVSSYIQQASTSNIFLATNQFGASNLPADGISTTGFTFFSICAASSAGFGLTAFQSGNASITAVANTPGHLSAAPNVHTSGFTITTYRNPTSVSTYLIFNITTIAATTLAGKYFTFSSLPGPTSYYMWFTVDGAGSDPAPGGTGIQVNLKSTYTANDVAAIVTYALTGCQVNAITTVAASLLVGGDYFTFGATNSNNYFPWYTVDGVGTAPSVSGYIGIKVDVLSTDTAAQVATKTMIAINKMYFAVPNYLDKFLRGFSATTQWDLDNASRFGVTPLVYGNMLGTYQLDQLVSHLHVQNVPNTTNPQTGGSTFCYVPPLINSNTTETGGTENRGINASVNWVIKY